MIACNVAVFAWLLVTGGLDDDASLRAHGALLGTLVAQGEWWRIITSGFLHGGWMHIVLNMIALYQVGCIVETVIGSARTAFAYGVSLIGSGVAVVLFAPHEITIGASGAIFGLFGTLVAMALRMGRRGRALLNQVVVIVGLNLAYGFVTPNISNVGHLGGLLSGFAIGALIVAMLPSRRSSSPATRAEETTGDAPISAQNP